MKVVADKSDYLDKQSQNETIKKKHNNSTRVCFESNILWEIIVDIFPWK